MPETLTASESLADALKVALDAATAHDPNTHAAPACIVWTDEKGEWSSLLARLRPAWPHLLTLGEYAPEARTGPAIWLRTALGGALPEAQRKDGVVPIVYLPGISRSALRAVATLPREHQPLAELQYRGVVFSQVSGRDWTPLAFLASEDGGLGLDVARDAATGEAMLRALPELLDRPLVDLSGRRLEADDFNALLAPDPARDLLRWIDAPEGFRSGLSPEAWAAFCAVSRTSYGVAPEADGVLGGAAKLGERSGRWRDVWDRYAEAPHLYPALPERLSQACPPQTGDLFAGGAVRETWPQDNTAEEEILRSSLLSLENATAARAAEQIRTLEERHGVRREWVWAALGQAPLACALELLAALAEAATHPVAGPTPEACADAYRADGWRADDAFLRALAAATGPEEGPVRAAAVALYRPWLEGTARAFDAALGDALPPQPAMQGTTAEAGTVWLFVDALRYDVGQRLADELEASGAEVERGSAWAALPPITATAKPACSPVADGLGDRSAMHDFAPETADGQPLTTARHRALLRDRGFPFLASGETGDARGSAWAEIGTLDKKGHEDGWALAHRIDDLVGGIATRIRDLLGAGWREVRVVTDHGWLLLPGGLPRTDLPKALTNVKWGRCAELVPGARTDLPVHGWFWNPDVQLAVAPTIHSFSSGTEYAHGGITLQECLVPSLVVTSGAPEAASARIAAADWRGLRCRIDVEGESAGLSVDLRQRPADAGSSVASGAKPVADGQASLIVPDDTLEGSAVVVVLLDGSGRVVHQLSTVIGG